MMQKTPYHPKHFHTTEGSDFLEDTNIVSSSLSLCMAGGAQRRKPMGWNEKGEAADCLY